MSSRATPATRAESRARHCTVTSFDGTSIHYDLYDSPARETVLVVPGFWRDRRHESMTRVAELLLREGYRPAVMDVRGHGESGGTYGFNLHEHHDVAAVAIDLLEQHGARPLSLVGFSYGGAISIATMARHDLPIACAVLISPVADFGMIAPRLNPLTMHRHLAFSQVFRRPRFPWRVAKIVKLRALDDVARVHVPLCLIHVKNDWLIGHEHSVALYEAASEPKELHVLDVAGNYHADRILSVAPERIEPLIRDFLARYARG